MRQLSAEQLYDSLHEANISSQSGEFCVNFAGVNKKITQKSGIGDLLQEWLGFWMEQNNIYYRTKDNTQEFPDFYLSDSNNKSLLELKTFDSEASPNFDIANFRSYIRSLSTDAYRLDAKYLIFGYTLDDKGYFQIKKIWLNNIEEITCPADKSPVRHQKKYGVIYNIRPIIWKSRSKFNPFNSKRDFVEALHKTAIQEGIFTQDMPEYNHWFDGVAKKYYEQTGNSL